MTEYSCFNPSQKKFAGRYTFFYLYLRLETVLTVPGGRGIPCRPHYRAAAFALSLILWNWNTVPHTFAQHSKVDATDKFLFRPQTYSRMSSRESITPRPHHVLLLVWQSTAFQKDGLAGPLTSIVMTRCRESFCFSSQDGFSAAPSAYKQVEMLWLRKGTSNTFRPG